MTGFWGGSAGFIESEKPLHERHAFDFYPTPNELCSAALDEVRQIMPHPVHRILDPGAGAGPWGVAARSIYWNAEITGIELRADAQPMHPYYDRWINADFLADSTEEWKDQRYDLIIGNPPYGQREKGKAYVPLAEMFVRQSMKLLAPGGILCFLLRAAFMEGVDRGRGLFQEYQPMRVYSLMQRPSFTSDGKTDATAYALFIWKYRYDGDTVLKWLDWKQSAKES